MGAREETTMRTHRFAWATVAGAVAASCAAYDLVTGGWLRLALLGSTMALFGGLLGFVLGDERPDRWAWARRGAVWSGVGAMAADALVVTGGAVGALVGLALVLTSPVVVRSARSRLLAWSTRRTAGPPEILATRDLLRRWDWTTGEVLRAGIPIGRRLALVEERRALLDELERRAIRATWPTGPVGRPLWCRVPLPTRRSRDEHRS